MGLYGDTQRICQVDRASSNPSRRTKGDKSTEAPLHLPRAAPHVQGFYYDSVTVIVSCSGNDMSVYMLVATHNIYVYISIYIYTCLHISWTIIWE